MAELARINSSDYLNLTEISKKHGISVFFLKKLVRALRKSNLIISREGPTGGYRLSKPPEQISLWEIINVSSGMEKKNNYPRKCPLIDLCLPQNITSIINKSLRDSLSKITLNYLII